MNKVCFYFQVHQPLRLRRYRFFDMGLNHNYYDDYLNKLMIRKVVDNSYLPMNNLLMDLIKVHGDKIKICMSISGITIEQLKWYAPDALKSFQKLINTGNVELLSETYNYSLSSLTDLDLFKQQVIKQHKLLEETFGVTPKIFKNTELLFSDDMAEVISKLSYKACLIEGARHILGWRSSEYLYESAEYQKLKLITRSFSLSDDIEYRFGNTSWDQWPLTAEKYLTWIDKAFEKGECLTLGLDYENFGTYHSVSTGIFDFMKELLRVLATNNKYKLITPSEIVKDFKPAAQLHIPYPITWADDEKDTSTWLGNELQEEAFKNLYSISKKMLKCKDPELIKDYDFIQSSDNFIYMSTKFFSKGSFARRIISPYDSPYNAYINYMNVLSDFLTRM
ncbi:glycoside hydrolase family 57 protein [Bacteroidales bacterium OttesenSCG-928-K03]|nr:glycoside hydrolase family 57 protein [Odoribacter sp. OttesenSCG-928-L07]MDL2239584.1 glycoside hydrolase family 57 protein [Bacteroidales bacterium OttesenSCG-928-L14]MDL2242544.1 glycoside hydrolase family 57 protein [Bacteroidales bacterium OttesenSCG-928-K03]